MNEEATSTEQKYTAPALEKGLDIIEFLAASAAPRTVFEISEGLGRSRGELFRMLSVLQHRGIINKTESGDAFEVTDRLFSLRLKRSMATQITSIALPEMERFCLQTGQNCHLALRSNQETVVLLRVEHPENLNISVPIGHRRKVWGSPSGRCILAFSNQVILETILSSWDADTNDKDAFLRHLEEIRSVGYAKVTDSFAIGVSGISAPIFNQVDEKCEFALTTTVFERVVESSKDIHSLALAVRDAAKTISAKYYL
jgi:DNA-binding IclR family transcriptional regulator